MTRFAISLVLAALLGGAPGETRAEPDQCRPQGEPLNLFLDRELGIARLQQLPDACLKELFRGCSRAAREALLDGGSAAVCSMGYEALLRGSFKGDFNALMAWWRADSSASSK